MVKEYKVCLVPVSGIKDFFDDSGAQILLGDSGV
jgi:hypothetical protein